MVWSRFVGIPFEHSFGAGTQILYIRDFVNELINAHNSVPYSHNVLVVSGYAVET